MVSCELSLFINTIKEDFMSTQRMITEIEKDKIVEIYKNTYSVSEIQRNLGSGIGRKRIEKILKDLNLYEGLSGVNYLAMKAKMIKAICLKKYGVDNISKLTGGSWLESNKIPYNKPEYLTIDFEKYKKNVISKTRKNIKKIKNLPSYCEYTGIQFSDMEGPTNPNCFRKRSVDHIIPIIHCYINGRTVEETSHISNLKFVLRYVNSVKGNTTQDSFLPLAPKIREIFINENIKHN